MFVNGPKSGSVRRVGRKQETPERGRCAITVVIGTSGAVWLMREESVTTNAATATWSDTKENW